MLDALLCPLDDPEVVTLVDDAGDDLADLPGATGEVDEPLVADLELRFGHALVDVGHQPRAGEHPGRLQPGLGRFDDGADDGLLRASLEVGVL